MSMVIVVVSGGLVVAFEKAVLNFPKKIFRQPVEQCNGDPMLFGTGAERKTLSGHTRIVVPRAVIKILRWKMGRRVWGVARRSGRIPIIVLRVLHEVGGSAT